jgi:hypothetical protein
MKRIGEVRIEYFKHNFSSLKKTDLKSVINIFQQFSKYLKFENESIFSNYICSSTPSKNDSMTYS